MVDVEVNVDGGMELRDWLVVGTIGLYDFEKKS